MRYYKKKELLILSLIYLASQGMLLIVSGRWWDDWCFHNQPFWALKLMAMQLGRPTLIAIVKFANFLPEPGYRIITFLMIYFCMLFTYKILRVWLKADARACFWICALYAVIPANDCRIVLAVFPYTIGLFFFMAGLSYLSGVLFRSELAWKNRIISWILFLLSFILNSNLCFYAIVLLMILMKENWKLKHCIKYIDYLILPIAFLGLKSHFFPVYGLYAGYNTLTLGKLIGAIKLILPADLFILKSLVSTFITYLSGKRVLVVLVLILIVCLVITCRKKIITCLRKVLKREKQIGESFAQREEITEVDLRGNCRNKLGLLIIGIICLSLGLFSYVAVRQYYSISTVGLQGRDATLIALGAAIIIYELVDLLFRKKVQKYLFICAIVGGIIFFNTYYLSYQQDYYRQLGFQYQLSQNKDLNDCKNIVYLNSDSGIMNIQSFYSLNGAAEDVYGTQDKYIMSGFGGLSCFSQEDFEGFVSSGNYHMTDYDITNKEIDAVVEYSLKAGLGDTLKMKIYEMFDKDSFERCIESQTSMNVYYRGTDEFDAILQAYGYEEVQ